MSDMPAKPTLPPIPELFGRLQPPELPLITFETAGFIRGNIHKWRKKRMAEVAKYEAEILEANERSTMAMDRSLQTVLTFGERYQTAIMREQHARRMMEIEAKTGEAVLAQEVYKAQLLGGEVKDFELTFSHKLALFKKEEEACLTE
jgi:hypothetical protein